MIIKVIKNLNTKEYIIRQAKNNIKNIDKRMKNLQNSSTRFFVIFYITFATIIKSTNAIVQVQTFQVSDT